MENLDQGNNKNVSSSLVADYGASDSDSDDTEAHSAENSEESMELSEMVLKNNIINACAHGPLSGNRRDDVDTTRNMIIDSSENGMVDYEVTEYRDLDSDTEDSSSSSSDSSDSDVESVKDVEEVSSGDENEASNTVSKIETPKVQGELGLDDLPPIEDLAISLPSQETTKIGTIASIVDRLVIVRALPQTPAVNIDSVLFLDNGAQALGKVFDVFGPVTEPHYCVRFNSQEHVKERGVQPGMDVFIAPKNQEHTSYVFLAELMRMKGSDASWLNDVEPPPSQVEFSDDEEERRVKRQNKQNRQDKEQEPEQEDSEKSTQPRKDKRNQRPSDSSSRFGSGPSRGRNPFSNNSRRAPANIYPRFGRPWPDMRTPPPHCDYPPMGPPFNPPMFPPSTPPPFMGPGYQFGGGPRMQPPPMPPFHHQGPIFGSNYCNVGNPPWGFNNGPPPPPGT